MNMKGAQIESVEMIAQRTELVAEWQGLSLLNRKRDEKPLFDLKK